MCARWRSTAAIAAAVTASTICCREGGRSAPEAFTMLEFVARGGGRCVTRGLNIRGGNGGVSLPLRSAAIYKKVLSVCLVLCVGGAGRSHYLMCLRRWSVWRSHGRSNGLRSGAVRWWWRSRWQKNQPDQDGVSKRCRGGSHGPIARRLGCHRPIPRGHGGVGWRSPPGR